MTEFFGLIQESFKYVYNNTKVGKATELTFKMKIQANISFVYN